MVSCVVIVVDLVRLGIAVAVPVTAGLLGGVVIGVGASRMSRLSWDETQAKVIGNIDALGAVILVANLLLTVFRGALLAQWFSPEVVGAAGVAVLAGLMRAQVLGTVRGVVRVMQAVKRAGRT